MWNDLYLHEFIPRPDTLYEPIFFIKADILETEGEILANTISEQRGYEEPGIIWIKPALLRVFIAEPADTTYHKVRLYVQLGAFPTQWKAGNTLRLNVTLLGNGEVTQMDIKLPEGKQDIYIEDPVFILPEYSLEHLGGNDY